MNQFQSTENGKGLLKDYYPEKEISPMKKAVRIRREKKRKIDGKKAQTRR